MNFWHLSVIAFQLNKLISNQKLLKCFSNSVDEIYFEFENYHFSVSFYLGEIFFFFNQNQQSEGRLHKAQFREIVNQKVKFVKCHFFERSFEIKFSNSTLVFKCHQKKSNIILFSKNRENNIYRNNLESDKLLNIETFYTIENNLISNKLNFDHINLKKIIEKAPFSIDINKDIQENIKLIKEKISEFSLVFENSELSFSLQNHNLSELSKYSSNYIKINSIISLKSEFKLKTEKAIKSKQNSLLASQNALNDILNLRSFEEIGNILLSNAHLYVPKSSKILAFDIYNNKEIEIKLNDELNLPENANYYFKKEKSKPKQISVLQDKIEKLKQSILQLESELEKIDQSDTFKSLKKIDPLAEKEKANLPYRQFFIEGHEIRVGKNAANNDMLLSNFSKPNDYWFHAKDVSGSHVVLPFQPNISKNIIEQAASIAAYYSSQKTQNFATVIFTQRKFVRKIKGAAKGKVIVTKESILLVKPCLPEIG